MIGIVRASGSCLSRRQTSPAIELGQHEIEHHQVGTDIVRPPERLGPRTRGEHVPAFLTEMVTNQLGDIGLVLDDEHATTALYGIRRCGIHKKVLAACSDFCWASSYPTACTVIRGR